MNNHMPCRQHRRTVITGLLAGLLAVGLQPLLPEPAVGRCVEHPHHGSFAAQSAVGWDLTPNGLLAIYYSEHGHGPDHVSLHRIVNQGYDASSPGEMKQSFGPRVTVLRSSDTAGDLPYYYVFFTNPLFYGAGLDSFGFAERLWQDRDEDGLNGNEVRNH
jgi:hypothetical protein